MAATVAPPTGSGRLAVLFVDSKRVAIDFFVEYANNCPVTSEPPQAASVFRRRLPLFPEREKIKSCKAFTS